MTKRRLTFREIQEAAESEMDQSLMARCREASGLAKVVSGGRRRQLYRVKNRGLVHLINKGRASVGVDNCKCPGLLSIRVRGQGALHSHEAWLGTEVQQVQNERNL